MDVINPATEKAFATIPAATAEDVDAAVAAATAAFKSGHWSRTTGAYRAKFLRAIAQKVLTCMIPLWHPATLLPTLFGASCLMLLIL